MGGLTIIPDSLIDDIVVSETSVLLLPGADTWNAPKHGTILEKASEFFSSGAMVCAICGATAALAGCGLLDNRPHTSNGEGFLKADTLEAWYAYFSTGNPEYFFSLMQTLPSDNRN